MSSIFLKLVYNYQNLQQTVDIIFFIQYTDCVCFMNNEKLAMSYDNQFSRLIFSPDTCFDENYDFIQFKFDELKKSIFEEGDLNKVSYNETDMIAQINDKDLINRLVKNENNRYNISIKDLDDVKKTLGLGSEYFLPENEKSPNDLKIDEKVLETLNKIGKQKPILIKGFSSDCNKANTVSSIDVIWHSIDPILSQNEIYNITNGVNSIFDNKKENKNVSEDFLKNLRDALLINNFVKEASQPCELTVDQFKYLTFLSLKKTFPESDIKVNGEKMDQFLEGLKKAEDKEVPEPSQEEIDQAISRKLELAREKRDNRVQDIKDRKSFNNIQSRLNEVKKPKEDLYKKMSALKEKRSSAKIQNSINKMKKISVINLNEQWKDLLQKNREK